MYVLTFLFIILRMIEKVILSRVVFRLTVTSIGCGLLYSKYFLYKILLQLFFL